MEVSTFKSSRSYSCHVLNLSSFLLILLLFSTNPQSCLAGATTPSSTDTYKAYIKIACSSTLYPKLCYKSLSSYASDIEANPFKLCTTALRVALRSAQNTSSTLSVVSDQQGLSTAEAAVIKDCVDNVKDSIHELWDSVDSMGQLGGSDVEFQIESIKTWVSAALTDENTCTDGFDGKKVNAAMKENIRTYIRTLAELTSNALALIKCLKY